MIDARRLLASHRLNYTSQGSQHLEILWWEFPPGQWESLRFRVSMNFMETPAPGLEENSKMTESRFTIAVAFVTELISLGVLALVPHGVLLMNVCPLFLVTKPGEPDQWRCIAGIKKGHQNQLCAAYPVYMTFPEDILPWMYPGGFSSVIDASKFVHMFLTVDEDHKFMVTIYPYTGDHFWYTRLPVGSSNSPVKQLPLPQPPLRARTDARTNPSAQRATQLRSVIARVYAVSRQNQITTTVP
jgi:hypothetical protein